MQRTQTAVRRTFTVEDPIEHAFDVFTNGFDRWWPRGHHLGEADLDVAVIEPFAGGRWYERGADGSECEWGEVVAWEPPARVELTWTITPAWTATTDPRRASTVEVRFFPESATSTRVEFEHRDFERLGDGWESMRDGVSSGWPSILDAFVAEVAS
jgi:uncharacterized protein YndB with AHSA1/START domain